MSDERTIAWLRFARVKGLGPVNGARLLSAFGTPEAVFAAGPRSLRKVEGVGDKAAAAVLDKAHLEEARQDLEVCEKTGLRVVACDEPSYPRPLREIADPPLLLFVKGEYKEEDEDAVAMVGCRNPDPYGESMAVMLAAGLARYKITVVSGMARGIDGTAQAAALKAGGRTVAVLGTPPDVVYPREHLKLYQGIIEKGAVLSELPPGTPPDPGNFPRRNRIISGLCRGVIMVQAMSEKSGALITVRSALAQGREVYAVPGNAGARSARMGNLLIKQGAKLVETAEDVALELRPLGTVDPLTAEDKREGKPGRQLELPDAEARIFALVPGPAEGVVDIDALTRQSGMSAGEALSALLSLELAGLVKALPGKRYVRIQEV